MRLSPVSRSYMIRWRTRGAGRGFAYGLASTCHMGGSGGSLDVSSEGPYGSASSGP